MGLIARDKNQVTLIYSGNSVLGKKVLGYIQPMKRKILAIDISKTSLGNSEWADLAKKMNMQIGDMIDKRMVDQNKTSDLDDTDWLKILQNDDSVLVRPILILGDKTAQIKVETEVLEFMGVDSAGIEKTMHTDSPNIQSSSKKDHFK
ncbi:MAG: hypothetical protein HKN48_02215 [Flavobacteriaceae bacterium]|nr:hypothetical protein [Flavobacteriaceae bacterium]